MMTRKMEGGFPTILLALLALSVQCSDDAGPGGTDDEGAADLSGEEEMAPDIELEPDLVLLDLSDAAPDEDLAPVDQELEPSLDSDDDADETDTSDLPPPDFPLEPIVEPVPFRVGVATDRLPAPLGIGTSGYGPTPGPISPFAGRFPATTREVMAPRAKVIALEGGMNRLLLFNLELVGISTEVRTSVARRLLERTGLDLTDSIFMGATHTHGGPGRLSTHPAFSLAQDRFWPQYYDRFIEFLVDLALQALDQLEEGRFGYTVIESNDLGSDRRCETPPMMTGTMVILRFDDATGTPLALALSYPIHGTIFDISEFTLTGDLGAGISAKIQERFDHLVPVLFFNSWGGDVSPASPISGPLTEGVSEQQARCEALGNRAADLVLPAFELIETTDDVDVASLTANIELSMDAIGYTLEEWPHRYGGVYCGMNIPAACWGEGDPPDPSALVGSCFPLFEDWAVSSTAIGIARIGGLALAAFPGEPCTSIGQQVVQGVRDLSGLEDVMFVGYSQDYCGYSETYEYWWAGGYESSGAIWGPKQGDYITSELLALADHFFDPEQALDIHETEIPERLIPIDSRVDYETEASLNLGSIIQDVPSDLTLGQVSTFTFAGGDPWLGTPRVELQAEDESSWSPFLRHNGTILANDGYEFEIRLAATSPSYRESLAHSAREFRWTAILPTLRSEPTVNPPLVGTFRMKATGQALVDEEIQSWEVYSSPFTVSDDR